MREPTFLSETRLIPVGIAMVAILAVQWVFMGSLESLLIFLVSLPVLWLASILVCYRSYRAVHDEVPLAKIVGTTLGMLIVANLVLIPLGPLLRFILL